MIKRVHSYGLEPGSAFVLLFIVNVIVNNLDAANDLAGIAVEWSAKKGKLSFDEGEITTLVFEIINLLVNGACLGYGVIIKGYGRLLKVWLIFQVLVAIFFGIGTVAMIAMLFVRSSSDVGYLVCLCTFMTLLYVYNANLANRCIPLLSRNKSGDVSSQTALSEPTTNLEPIGRSFRGILDHYIHDMKAGASLAIMTDILGTFYHFMYWLSLNETGVGNYNPIPLEDLLVRWIRYGICIIGFYFTCTERKKWLLGWCVVYFLSVVAGAGVTIIYIISLWTSGLSVHPLFTTAYVFTLILNLAYRMGVLYMCFRYSRKREGL